MKGRYYIALLLPDSCMVLLHVTSGQVSFAALGSPLLYRHGTVSIGRKLSANLFCKRFLYGCMDVAVKLIYIKRLGIVCRGFN